MLRDSDFTVVSRGEEFRAGILLWAAAWHQIPAASPPNDNRILSNFAGLGRDIRSSRPQCSLAWPSAHLFPRRVSLDGEGVDSTFELGRERVVDQPVAVDPRLAGELGRHH